MSFVANELSEIDLKLIDEKQILGPFIPLLITNSIFIVFRNHFEIRPWKEIHD